MLIRCIVFLLITASALDATASDPFDDPVTGFSRALLPILTSFEKANVETTLRGFIARADSDPGFRASEMDPSEDGLYLNAAVRDPEEVKAFSDRREKKGAVTRRIVEFPAPRKGKQAMIVEVDYGQAVSKDVLQAIDACIMRLRKY
jgi:hypothetical protein